MRFKTAIVLVMGALAAVAVAASVLAAVATTALDSTADRIETAVESVRVTQGLVSELLTHRRLVRRIEDVGASSALTAELAQVELHLEGHLDEAERFVSTRAEGELLRRARKAVGAYLEQPATRDAPTQVDAAVAALRRLRDINVEQARAARDRMRQQNGWADMAGLVIGVVLVVGVGWATWWLRTVVLRPVAAHTAAARAYAEGDVDARVPVEGPPELAQMAEAFNAMADELARQREARTTFLGGVAHDLRNPLTALSLTLGRIRRDRPLPRETDLRELLERIRSQSGRLERMIGDLVDLTRIELGELSIEPTEVALEALVAETITLYGPTRPGPITMTAPDAPVHVRCDPGRIGQVLNNLLSNASKYSPEESAIEVDLRRTSAAAIITVTDHGIGIPAADHEAIFEAFHRSESGRRSARGVGLGLWISRRIVEAHGGALSVESEPGRGTSFRMTLPLTDAADRT